MKKKKKTARTGRKDRKTAGRVSFVFGVAFLSLSSLLFRLAYLQVTRGSNFRAEASNQQISYVPVLPERGWIYDSNHQLLAYDTPTMGIVMTRLHNSKIQNYKDLAKLLAPVLQQSESTLLNRMKTYNTWEDQIYLLHDANDTQVSFVAEHKSELPGISLVVSSKRSYPHGNLAGQVLGYVGQIQGNEAKQYKGYMLDQIVGQSGVEAEYEKYLQGKVGRNAVVINNLGIPIQSLGLNPPPTPGDTLNLTIDGHLQAQAQQIVANKIAQLGQQGTSVRQAAAVMLNPKTGGVLAMVSYPYLNPNWFLNPKQYQQHAKELNTYPSPIYNDATQGVFMPGSTVKPANMLLGLLDHVITPTTEIDDPGYLMIGNYQMHGDAVNGMGWVNPVETLAVSDDIFMYQLSLWMAHYPPTGMSIETWIKTLRTQALDKFHTFEEKFGLGVKTGIDLPGESHGYFTDTKQLYDLPATAIGQDQAFTPIELADYVATIANSGKRMQPHVLHSIISPKGQNIKTFQPKVTQNISAPQAFWNVIHQGMYAVCNTPQGTASGSFMNAPYKAAGKTGTAQQGNGKNDISVFIGYAPYKHPQVAVAVVLPGAGYGATGAVPIARDMMDAYFKEHHEFFPKSQWTNTSIQG